MNKTASYSSDLSISRRCSTETIFSIQEKETDYVHDSSDTEAVCDSDVEYSPVTEPDDDDGIVSEDSSGHSDSEFISTEVIVVSVKDDGDLELADSEQTETGASDSEIDLNDYWQCAQCRETNNNPIYRYCEKCFKVRKNFFPPRPKRKHKRKTPISEHVPRSFSQDSGIESVNSQPLSQDINDHPIQESTSSAIQNNTKDSNADETVGRTNKRRADSVDRNDKRIKIDCSESDSESDHSDTLAKLVKTVSDPALTIEDVDPVKLTGSTSSKKLEPNDNMCIVCYTEPKSGVFVHGRIAHICCCYKCAVKVWTKSKRCPVCNCKVSNVLKAIVM